MKEYYIVADCGGGDEYNPYSSLERALGRVAGETGIEIWEVDAGKDLDLEIADGRARCVFSRW